MADKQKSPIRFDENGRLSPADWDRLLSQLDEEIRQAEEAAARRAGWSEECDELWDEDFVEEVEEVEEKQEEEEELEEYLDLDGF